MSARSLVIVGAGFHAKVVLEAVLALQRFDVVGLTDPAERQGHVLDVPVLGSDDILPDLLSKGVRTAVIAVGDNRLRQTLGRKLRDLGFGLPAIVHPQAFVSPTARVLDGAVVMARAVIGTQSIISELAVVNTGAIIDHDNIIGEAAHIAPGCSLAGSVRVGARTLVGVGSAVCPKVAIGSDAIVAAGAAVISDVPDGASVGGVPARALRSTGGVTP